jgi:4a-hydroxytetrahydrobiopterin dehydratase
MDVLDDAATNEALRRLPGWERTPDSLAKTFTFDTFRSALLFVERVGDSTENAAEVAGHHPNIDIRSSTVRIAIPSRGGSGWTHADMMLAHRIERLRGEHGHPVGLAGPS